MKNTESDELYMIINGMIKKYEVVKYKDAIKKKLALIGMQNNKLYNGKSIDQIIDICANWGAFEIGDGRWIVGQWSRLYITNTNNIKNALEHQSLYLIKCMYIL